MASNRHFYEGLQIAPADQAGLETDGRGLESTGGLQHHVKSTSADQHFPQSPQEKQQRDRNKVSDIRRTTWLLLLLIILLVAAIAATAGVLGTRKTNTTTQPATGQSSPAPSSGSPTSQHTSQSSASSTFSTSPATASASPYSCTNNGTSYQTSDNSIFIIYCNTNFLVGSNYNTTAAVLTTLSLNSFGACLEACAVSNSLGVAYRSEGICQSATWFASGTGLDECYLKNATANTDGSNGIYQPDDTGSQTGSLVA